MRWENRGAVEQLFREADEAGQGHVTVSRIVDGREEQLASSPVDDAPILSAWLDGIAADLHADPRACACASGGGR